MKRKGLGNHKDGKRIANNSDCCQMHLIIQLGSEKDEVHVDVGLETTDPQEADVRAVSIVKILENILMYKRPAGRISSFSIE